MDDVSAKVEFLKTVQSYPTFGSTFFVVKQTTDNNLPETILIAINRNGFNIIDPERRVSFAKRNKNSLLIFFNNIFYFRIFW